MDIDLETDISTVTVFPDRALVVRTGKARIEAAGSHGLRIGGLPLAVLRDALRAAGRGPAGTRILGVEQAEERHAAAPEETLSRLREVIAGLEHDVALVQARQRTIEEEQGWLRSLGEQSARSLAWGMARGTAKTDDASAFFAYAAEESQRLASVNLDLERQRARTQQELDARRREYAALGGAGWPDRLSAVVRVEVPQAGDVEIELSYLIRGASWRPRYDARVDVDAGRVHLTQQALVRQQTGEEWGRVPLALSTARPAVAASLPDEPDPWYLVASPIRSASPASPAQGQRLRAFHSTAQSVEADAGPNAVVPGEWPQAAPMFSALAIEAQPAEAELAEADVERSGAAQVFKLPGETDIPSDGSPHTVGLGEYDLACHMDYVAVPSVASGAHLRAVVANSSGRVLLPGELHVFHVGVTGDEYVGATSLDLTAEGADLKLYLGVDDNVTVKRELIQRDTDKGGLLGGIRRITYGYRVTLGNRTAATQRVFLKDRLPVPRHERVKVSGVDLRPQPTSRTRLEQLTWELTLAAGEERRIEWRFTVEAPADLDVSGLP